MRSDYTATLRRLFSFAVGEAHVVDCFRCNVVFPAPGLAPVVANRDIDLGRVPGFRDRSRIPCDNSIFYGSPTEQTEHFHGVRSHRMTVPLLAYIDPVSGFIILQVIIAGVLGTVAFFRRSLARILGKLIGRSAPGDEKDSGQE